MMCDGGFSRRATLTVIVSSDGENVYLNVRARYDTPCEEPVWEWVAHARMIPHEAALTASYLRELDAGNIGDVEVDGIEFELPEFGAVMHLPSGRGIWLDDDGRLGWLADALDKAAREAGE